MDLNKVRSALGRLTVTAGEPGQLDPAQQPPVQRRVVPVLDRRRGQRDHGPAAGALLHHGRRGRPRGPGQRLELGERLV